MGGHEWDWDIARLDYMLQTLCVDSVQFRRMMAIAIGASTDQLLTVITYLDEVITYLDEQVYMLQTLCIKHAMSV